MSTNVGLKLKPLTDTDRCDRCGSRAYVRVAVLRGDLVFCGHHFDVHEPALHDRIIGLVDDRHKLRELERES